MWRKRGLIGIVQCVSVMFVQQHHVVHVGSFEAAWKALCLPPLPLWGCVEEAVHLGQLYRINADANMPEPDKKHEALSGLGTQGGAAYPIPFCDLAAESLGPQLSI